MSADLQAARERLKQREREIRASVDEDEFGPVNLNGLEPDPIPKDPRDAEIERLRETLKSAKPVYETAKNSAAVRSGHTMSGGIKHYVIAPHILHQALRGESGDE